MDFSNFKRPNQEFSYAFNNDDNYSDDYTDDDDDYPNDDYKDNREDSFQFISAHNSPIETRMRTQSFHSPNNSQYSNVTNHSFVSSKVQSQDTKGFFTKYSNMFMYTILCVLITIVLSTLVNKTDDKAMVEEKKLDLVEINNVIVKSMHVIQSRFKNQKVYIWNDISAGIYDVALFPTKPTTIILFGKEKDTLNCLARLLGQLSGNILGSNDYLMLTPSDFPHDIGHVIHNLKVQILEKKAVIVQDLLGINAEAMKAFHNFCDREKPLVEHAIYIITIIVDEYKPSQKELEFVEKQIFNRLSKYIEKDILDPLITRLTDGIIVPVLPESNTSFSYSDCSLSINNKL
ncbi:torsin interacting protein isoform X2 [Xylocopa sonorina]